MHEYWKWNPAEYGLNVREMDEEHHVLISSMNSLYRLHVAKAPREAQAEALQSLNDFAAKHFADEESLMAKIGFPADDLRIHRSLHQKLLSKLALFTAELEKVGRLTDEFFAFVAMWLKAHILGIDAKYARHAQQLGASPAR